MKKRYIILSILFIIFFIFTINTKTYANDLDEIVNYEVIVDPRMNDGSLDIKYEITWKVLDSTTEGPLSWVQIGTPNSYFDTPTALTNNIKNIQKYNGSYVRIDFKQSYRQGEEVTFKFSIHQPYMHKVSGKKCKYKFTPAWFTDIKVDNLTIKWNSDEVKKSDEKSKEDNYLVWNKKNMKKGEKLTVNVQYNKSSFSALSASRRTDGNFSNTIVIFVIVFILAVVISIISGGGRRRIL